MSIVSLVLAAGEASRFGSSKQLIDIHGQSMLNYIVSQHRVVGHEKIVVVLGANAEKIQKQLEPGVDVVVAKNWQLGMGESIRCGVDYIVNLKLQGLTHIIISLGDQIEVKSAQIAKLHEGIQQNPRSIIAAEYANNVGVPACFPKQMFVELLSLGRTSADLHKGAKSVIQANKDKLIRVKMPEAQFDIDTTEDLRRWRKQPSTLIKEKQGD